MAEELQTLMVRLDADIERLRRGMRDAGRITETTTQKIERQMARANRAFNNLGKNLRNVGQRLSIAVTAPVAGLSALFVKAASDAEEMTSKFNVVFGQNAAEVRAWAEEYGDSVGRATQDLMEMAASVQDTFVPLGFARSEASEMSKSLTQLAVDVASFNNATDAETMRDFQSALVGNHEAVRKYGIIITESTLKQELQRMGMEKATGAALDQAKVQARLNLIMAGTADAHGDAARTADSTANSFRALQAQFKEVSIELGQRLIPFALKLIDWAKDALAAFQSLSPEMQNLSLLLAGLAAALGPVLIALGFMASGLAALMSPIALAVAGLVGLTAAVVAFHDDIMQVLKPIGEAWWKYIGEPVDKVMTFVVKKVAAVYSWLAEKLGALADLFGFEDMSEKMSQLSAAFNAFAESEVMVLEGTIDSVTSYAAKTGSEAAEIIRKKFQEVMGAFGSPEAPDSPSTPTVPDVGPVRDAMNELGDVAKKNQTAYESWLRSTSDGLARAVIHANGLGDALKNILVRLAESELSNLLFNTFTGGKGGSIIGGLTKAIGLPGFATGGSFRVGGSGGTDSQVVAFRASPDETVTVSRPGQRAGGITIHQTIAPNFAGNAATQQDLLQMAEMTKQAAREAVRQDFTTPSHY